MKYKAQAEKFTSKAGGRRKKNGHTLTMIDDVSYNSNGTKRVTRARNIIYSNILENRTRYSLVVTEDASN